MPPENWTPPVIPARTGPWDRAASDVMTRHMGMPHIWGTSDCLIPAADLCLAMTGVDPMAGLRGYSTEAEANAILAALGFAGVEDALAAVFAPIPLASARRFDCGVFEGRGVAATMIIMGPNAFGKTASGPAMISTLRLKAAYAIGAR